MTALIPDLPRLRLAGYDVGVAFGETKQGQSSDGRPEGQNQDVGTIQVTGSNNQVIIQQSAGGPSRNNDGSERHVPASAETALSTGWTWFFGIPVALITLFALPVLVNLLTGQNPLPGWLQAIVPYSAPLIGASLFLLGVLYLWQTRLQRSAAKSPGLAQDDRIEIPSRDTLLTKSRNIHRESEDAFERAIDVQLGIQRVPQLVSAQHLPHIAARGTTAARPLTEPLVDYLLRVEKLLLVGAPGAGKSAMLRTLWGELLSRAQSDPRLPVPFLLNLSTFSRYSGTFRNWLAESLRECAGMPLAIGQVLLEGGQLFLLLDGLDEMAESKRATALSELNELLGAADPALGRCVVCSRTLEYNQTGVILHLPAALELQPLTIAQVQEAVAGAGPAAQPLAAALKYDLALADLLATPLLLTIGARTFAGNPSLVLASTGPAELRRALFNEYIVQMLRRSSIQSETSALRVLRCMHWLGQQMTNEQSTLFLMERIQPIVLRATRLYKLVVGLAFGLVIGPFASLLGQRTVGLVFGLLGGLVFGLVADKIQPVEQMRWSWSLFRAAWRSPGHLSEILRIGLSLGLGIGLVVGSFSGLVGGLVGGPGLGMLFRLVVWLLAGLCGGLGLGMLLGLLVALGIALSIWLDNLLSSGWRKAIQEHTVRPNQGVYASIRNGVAEGIVTGLVVALVGALVAALKDGLSVGQVVALVVALRGGLGQALKHYVLRLFLLYEVDLPLRLVPFLEQCRSMLLLRREGGGYRFWHVTLQEHFAALDDARMNDIAARSLAKDAYQSKY